MVARDLPFSLPTAIGIEAIGIHYTYPLIGVGIWSAIALFGSRRDLARPVLMAAPCYAAIPSSM